MFYNKSSGSSAGIGSCFAVSGISGNNSGEDYPKNDEESNKNGVSGKIDQSLLMKFQNSSNTNAQKLLQMQQNLQNLTNNANRSQILMIN
jgi:hypothetical protein